MNTKATFTLISTGIMIKKSSCYVLPSWPLQDITQVYYISPLVKHDMLCHVAFFEFGISVLRSVMFSFLY